MSPDDPLAAAKKALREAHTIYKEMLLRECCTWCEDCCEDSIKLDHAIDAAVRAALEAAINETRCSERCGHDYRPETIAENIRFLIGDLLGEEPEGRRGTNTFGDSPDV